MRLAYRSWGDRSGPVALLLHGGAGSSAEWEELGSWLADRGWDAIAVDLRGHGDTPVDAATMANPSLSVEADDLVETITAIRPEAGGVGLLLGSSYGAMVGLVCAAEHPDFADRLVLGEPAGRESCDRAQYLKEKHSRHEDPVGFLRALYGEVPDSDPRTMEDLEAVIQARAVEIAASNQPYALARHEMFADVDVVELAERCVVPTLVLLGRDKDSPLGQGTTVTADMRRYSMLIGDERKRFCAALPNARVHVLDSGHDVYRGMCQEYVDLLSAWLGHVDAASTMPET